jgi:hypothetical protein
MKFIPIGLLICLGIGVGYLLFHKSPVPNHNREHAVIDSTAKAWQSQVVQIKLEADSFAIVNHQIDSSLQATTRRLKAAESALTIAVNHATDLASIIEDSHDTGMKLSTCDSLAMYVTTHAFQIEALNTLTDSLVAQHVRMMMVKDEQIARQSKAIGEMDTVISNQYKNYNSLYKDYKSEVRQKKTSAWVARSLGVVALVLSGIIIAK